MPDEANHSNNLDRAELEEPEPRADPTTPYTTHPPIYASQPIIFPEDNGTIEQLIESAETCVIDSERSLEDFFEIINQATKKIIDSIIGPNKLVFDEYEKHIEAIQNIINDKPITTTNTTLKKELENELKNELKAAQCYLNEARKLIPPIFKNLGIVEIPRDELPKTLEYAISYDLLNANYEYYSNWSFNNTAPAQLESHFFLNIPDTFVICTKGSDTEKSGEIWHLFSKETLTKLQKMDIKQHPCTRQPITGYKIVKIVNSDPNDAI